METAFSFLCEPVRDGLALTFLLESTSDYRLCLKRSSIVTSLWTILLCFPPTTPYVVTKVITSDFLFLSPFGTVPYVPSVFFIAVGDAILVRAEFHFAQVDNPVCSFDYQINLKAGNPFSGSAVLRHVDMAVPTPAIPSAPLICLW